ncbi:DUF1240 domain-containing protein [Pectobacterium parmentieri]|uniref:DUF1240 domain-containing protein n=1 Tax=Pectobacterium parmentieri TaxID=1905730 RepID=A0A8B3FHM9_PECPM|nr:DUF1240 domain-containing protein [Pectobacterium parmentieri]AYH02785.1 DUF1240 domain-containing protein [Pectobacterium parmentieri]AYH07050.1 DUF1240 domain-containing protein [Pectobacterium parmentieri]AYH11573.1 DUF1240 domain-containing protein [Pectobacterium parmentieri]AYH15861.1 DUF1240 domain-containing protein [Pectobacterium parmentieri]AYH17710.1 DUF1240 domain-containing protein [Pectobacterium parmentieri]
MELFVVKVNRPFIGAFSVFILCLSCWGTWFSLSEYLSFFKSNDVIVFSWRVGVAIFGVPLSFYFSYACFFSAIKNEHVKINNKLGEWLVKFLIFGAVVSLFSSSYISYSLSHQGYKTCPKISWMDPNKYVKDITLCDK